MRWCLGLLEEGLEDELDLALGGLLAVAAVHRVLLLVLAEQRAHAA